MRKMAEGAGFEPAKELTPLNDLANRRLQPLGHPSAREWVITTYAGGFVPRPRPTVNRHDAFPLKMSASRR